MQALDRYQPVLPGMPERRSHDYARHGVTSLFAAFNIAPAAVLHSPSAWLFLCCFGRPAHTGIR